MDLVERALRALDSGKLVVVADDEDRENEGDLVGLADMVSPAMINTMITHGRGLVCFPITSALAQQLHLTLMSTDHPDPFHTAFTQSIDAVAQYGVSTGISAHDRATTIRMALRPNAVPTDFSRPGHIFPLIAHDGGVSVRRGHTEAAVELARLAGHMPAGVIVEILRADGAMARRDDLHRFAAAFQLPYLTISDILLARQKKGIHPISSES